MLTNLEVPPSTSDQFFWADFVELRALVHPDRCYSSGDLYGLVKSRCEEPHRDTNDHWFSTENRWRDLISFADVRKKEFDDAYPFDVSTDKDTLVLNFDTGNSSQVTYLNLLLASLMRHIPSKHRNELARYFEETCFEVFTQLMPEGSEVRATWAGGGAEAPYTGSLYQKMGQIAENLRCTANFKEQDFKPNNNGDGGIDELHPLERTPRPNEESRDAEIQSTQEDLAVHE